jgi:hypothetical protein
MQPEATRLLAPLTEGKARFALALPFTETGFYADLSLVTDRGDVRVSGTAEGISGGYEACYLSLAPFSPQNYWNGQSPFPPYPKGEWNPVDLLNDNDVNSIRRLLTNERTAHFFRDRDDFREGLTSKGVLDSACAIRLISKLDSKLELVIYASPKYPFGLQITNSLRTTREIVDRLEQFQLSG